MFVFRTSDILTANEELVLLTFEFIRFIESDHQYISLVKSTIKTKLTNIIECQLRSAITSNSDIDRTRDTSGTPDLFRAWSLNWTTDKPLFRKALRKFESYFSDLQSTTDSDDIKEEFFNSFQYSIIKQSRHASAADMTLAIEFFTAVSTASNQVEDDRITVIVTRILKAYFRNKKIDVASNANSNANLIDESRSFIKEWTCENIEFFDFNYEKNELIVSVDKHVLYRNVYAFIDRLKDMTMHRKSNKIRNVISQFLRESALIWHFAKLSKLEKNMLRKT